LGQVNLVQFDSINQLIPLTMIPLSGAHFIRFKGPMLMCMSLECWAGLLCRAARAESNPTCRSMMLLSRGSCSRSRERRIDPQRASRAKYQNSSFFLKTDKKIGNSKKVIKRATSLFYKWKKLFKKVKVLICFKISFWLVSIVILIGIERLFVQSENSDEINKME
jgi:hypothetical protein